MPALKYLDLSYNSFAYLPAKALNTVPALETLILDFNVNMTSLSDYGTAFSNTNLQTLRFNNCSVIGIQVDDISGLSSLTEFKAASNGIFSIYKDAFPAKLRDIDISFNQLSNADPRWFAGCTNLQSLEMQGNPFVCNCASEVYYYAARKYSVLYHTLACSNLGGSFIDDFPPQDYCNTTFTLPTSPTPSNVCPQHCACYNNNTQVECVSQRLTEVPVLPINAQIVNLNNNEIKSIHRFDFSSLPNLKVLTMNQNEISSINPAAFPNQLQNISLSTNRLADVSNVVWPSQMVTLDLSRNQLNSFNLTISDIALYSLTLDQNAGLSSISGLEKTAIVQLSCVACSLTSMPSPAIGNLQQINLQANQITGFQENVVYSGLKNLLMA
jgi:Leucine-rich repeat (LRR) protein